MQVESRIKFTGGNEKTLFENAQRWQHVVRVDKWVVRKGSSVRDAVTSIQHPGARRVNSIYQNFGRYDEQGDAHGGDSFTWDQVTEMMDWCNLTANELIQWIKEAKDEAIKLGPPVAGTPAPRADALSADWEQGVTDVRNLHSMLNDARSTLTTAESVTADREVNI